MKFVDHLQQHPSHICKADLIVRQTTGRNHLFFPIYCDRIPSCYICRQSFLYQSQWEYYYHTTFHSCKQYIPVPDLLISGWNNSESIRGALVIKLLKSRDDSNCRLTCQARESCLWPQRHFSPLGSNAFVASRTRQWFHRHHRCHKVSIEHFQ